jgi:hypothetical protein
MMSWSSAFLSFGISSVATPPDKPDCADEESDSLARALTCGVSDWEGGGVELDLYSFHTRKMANAMTGTATSRSCCSRDTASLSSCFGSMKVTSVTLLKILYNITEHSL